MTPSEHCKGCVHFIPDPGHPNEAYYIEEECYLFQLVDNPWCKYFHEISEEPKQLTLWEKFKNWRKKCLSDLIKS